MAHAKLRKQTVTLEVVWDPTLASPPGAWSWVDRIASEADFLIRLVDASEIEEVDQAERRES